MLLEVRNLTINLNDGQKSLPVVQDVSFGLEVGQAIGIVGESGCGKSVAAASLLRLLPIPTLSVAAGEFLLNGENLAAWDERKFNSQFRWRKASMIFQEAAAAFNPVLTIGRQFEETLKRVGKDISVGSELLQECGLLEVERIWHSYPHQLSGGMKQRVAIAMALVGDPQLLIADEPTTASDATVQLQILKLMKRLQKKRKMSIIFISHDLNVIRYICDHVYVLYCGRVVENQKTSSLLSNPLHPYTKGLLASSIGIDVGKKTNLPSIGGLVPSIDRWHQGCSFYNRCAYASKRCEKELPVLHDDEGKNYACWNPLKD